MKTRIQIKHAYEAPASGDGARFLVDRLWPRGLKKETLQLAGWLRNHWPTPSDAHRIFAWFRYLPREWIPPSLGIEHTEGEAL